MSHIAMDCPNIDNIIDMIDSPIWVDLITETDDGDMERDIQDSDENDPQNIAATIDIKKVLKTCLDSLDQADKRLLLLYWGAGMNTSQILSMINFSNHCFVKKILNIKLLLY